MEGAIAIRYLDNYNQEAIAIENADGKGWKLTYCKGLASYSKKFSTLPQLESYLRSQGYGWREVNRWRVTTLTA